MIYRYFRPVGIRVLPVVLVAMTMLAAGPAWADYKEGYDAYRKKNYDKAMSELLPLAKKGDAKSNYYIGLMYLNGLGVKGDPKAAAKWLEQAASKNHPAAQAELGWLYMDGSGVKNDPAKGVGLFREAAALNGQEGMFALGFLYETGQGGLPKDEKRAVIWYQKAVKTSLHVYAHIRLGLMYQNGRGTPKDGLKAAETYFKIADLLADPVAQYHLGKIFYLGDGIQQDYKAAREWFELAEFGSPDAQAFLGYMHEMGQSVEIDTKKAYVLYSLALNRLGKGELRDTATQQRDGLAKTLAPDVLAAAQQEVETQLATRAYAEAFSEGPGIFGE